MSKNHSRETFEFNGLSISSLSVDQGGDLEVEFDLPVEQTTNRWHTEMKGTRTFDVYEDEELEKACRRLFEIVKARIREPDQEREKIHCDRCEGSPCCRKYNVLTSHFDLERLAAGLGLPLAKLIKRHTVEATDWSGDFERQLSCDHDEEGEEKCVFLKPDSTGLFRCTVYEHRPQICRDFDMRTCDDFVPIEDVTLIH